MAGIASAQNDAKEPLLLDNPNRYVMFPIKHEEVWRVSGFRGAWWTCMGPCAGLARGLIHSCLCALHADRPLQMYKQAEASFWTGEGSGQALIGHFEPGHKQSACPQPASCCLFRRGLAYLCGCGRCHRTDARTGFQKGAQRSVAWVLVGSGRGRPAPPVEIQQSLDKGGSPWLPG